jgi:alpha-galactosidase
MKTYTMQDCFARIDENGIEMGNSLFSRQYRLERGLLYSEAVNSLWQGESQHIGDFGLDMENCGLSFSAGESDNHGLSETFFCLDMVRTKNAVTVKTRWTILPGLPFITGRTSVKSERPVTLHPGDDILDTVAIPQPCLKLTAVKLIDKSDVNDTLLLEERRLVNPIENLSLQGNIFIIADYLAGNTLMLVKEAPVPDSAVAYPGSDLSIPRGGHSARLIGSGLEGAEIGEGETFAYGSTIGAGSGDLPVLYKRYYRAMRGGGKQKRHYIMSNTWGDRSEGKAICHDFIKREIDSGAELGIDVVQIDAGWHRGSDFEKYYSADPNCWEINRDKFPEGFAPLAEYASGKGVKMGLWFSPDLNNDYENWEKDASIILDFYHSCGIKYFKLDLININNKIAESNFISLLNKISESSGGEIGLNLDITAHKRFGYLYEKHQGILFVENRYTDWVNYYPHRTMRNLWTLAKYFPPERFQFEVLNIRRNQDKYPDIPLAPKYYSMDYLFASVMVSNPLVWLEMFRLEDRDREALGTIIQCYRSVRRDFMTADMYPIGDEPDGLSFTGFQIDSSGAGGYLLLFREAGGDEEYTFALPRPLAGMSKLLYPAGMEGCAQWSWEQEKADRLTIKLKNPRSFVFLRY